MHADVKTLGTDSRATKHFVFGIHCPELNEEKKKKTVL